MKRIPILLACLAAVASTGAATSPAPAGWQLVWSDEFDQNGLPDPAKWDYDVGTGHDGWGNHELQF